MGQCYAKEPEVLFFFFEYFIHKCNSPAHVRHHDSTAHDERYAHRFDYFVFAAT